MRNGRVTAWMRGSRAGPCCLLPRCVAHTPPVLIPGPPPPLPLAAADPEDEAKWAAFDALVESWLGGSKPRVEVASYADQEEGEAPTNVLCARCYSLRHYGWAGAAGSGPDVVKKRVLRQRLHCFVARAGAKRRVVAAWRGLAAPCPTDSSVPPRPPPPPAAL